MLDTWGGLSPHIPPVQSLLSWFSGFTSSSPPRLHIKVSKEREQEKNLPDISGGLPAGANPVTTPQHPLAAPSPEPPQLIPEE